MTNEGNNINNYNSCMLFTLMEYYIIIKEKKSNTINK